jgi:aryl-alcohol dehydrogenase-like predicted oxidoreductase
MQNLFEKICIGTAQFGLPYGLTNKDGNLSENEVSKILALAMSNGISSLDTAPSYGDAEAKLGNIGVNNWNVITKATIGKENKDTDSFSESVKQSLQRLKLDNIYGILIHNPKSLHDNKIFNLLEELSNLKYKGVVSKIGVSVYDSQDVDFILANFDMDLIQIPFNIIDGRMIINGTLEKLKKRNIEIHARSIYLQGLLLMQIEDQIKKFGNWENIWTKFHSFCKDNDISPLQACLRYVIGKTEIDKVIIGIDNLQQLKETIQSVQGELQNIPSEILSYDDNLCNPLNWEIYSHLKLS